jgi:hypothetical protein
MNKQEANQRAASERATSERCLCREVVDHLQNAFGASPAARKHLANSRIEFLKAIREVINERIERLSSPGQQGTKIAVE